jgi:hypothetical protein
MSTNSIDSKAFLMQRSIAMKGLLGAKHRVSPALPALMRNRVFRDGRKSTRSSAIQKMRFPRHVDALTEDLFS